MTKCKLRRSAPPMRAAVRRHWIGGALILSLGLGMSPAARADDVTDQLNEALKAYQKKDLATASAALDVAQTLIRQMSADVWKTVLPEPLSGWTADDAESTSVGAAMLGGGTSVSRSYRKDGETVEITLVTDSPLLQGMGALVSSGMVTGSDMKLLVIDGRKATFTKSENSYQTLVSNKALVKVTGSKGVDDGALRGYLSAVKFQQIEKAAQAQ
jgi:hypothetical protein